MNYNNPYFNPYQQYPYTQPTQQQTPMTNYLQLTFINGIEGAKAFIVAPNQTIYLKDSDSNILYEKKADAQGRYTLTAFELKPVEINTPTAPVKTEYATTSDLNALKSFFTEQVNILSSEIKKAVRTQNNNVSEVLSNEQQ
jgi:hypothetical protein